MNWLSLGAMIFGALGGVSGLAAFSQAYVSRPKVRADATEILTDSALQIVRQIQDREYHLQSRVRELEKELEILRKRVREMERGLDDRDMTIANLLKGEK